MAKASKSLMELERLACAALRGGGAMVKQVAIAPTSSHVSDANWTLLHVNGSPAFDPLMKKLIRPVQARYDLAW